MGGILDKVAQRFSSKAARQNMGKALMTAGSGSLGRGMEDDAQRSRPEPMQRRVADPNRTQQYLDQATTPTRRR